MTTRDATTRSDEPVTAVTPTTGRTRPSPVRRALRGALLVGGGAALLTGAFAQPALAEDSEWGLLTCPAGQQVMVTERTSAGLTTITVETFVSRRYKSDWSTTMTRTGLQSARWQVTTTGSMDHAVTGASCVR